ncbi:MAG: hypothetical protein MRECE_1c164 [Mycoplasmataceae bacterium CE_OT135]|nr:MAG: hypothetical protein MRECE_1c003 [Mycoplasmataceae bacterium CE_OT135]KLL04375.1 MAG: hypothetical protein MRECE_1c164 [Mycoplasmataceae bacterium CE_OT135]
MITIYAKGTSNGQHCLKIKNNNTAIFVVLNEK